MRIPKKLKDKWDRLGIEEIVKDPWGEDSEAGSISISLDFCNEESFHGFGDTLKDALEDADNSLDAHIAYTEKQLA